VRCIRGAPCLTFRIRHADRAQTSSAPQQCPVSTTFLLVRQHIQNPSSLGLSGLRLFSIVDQPVTKCQNSPIHEIRGKGVEARYGHFPSNSIEAPSSFSGSLTWISLPAQAFLADDLGKTMSPLHQGPYHLRPSKSDSYYEGVRLRNRQIPYSYLMVLFCRTCNFQTKTSAC
jgi:hypothetical protein